MEDHDDVECVPNANKVAFYLMSFTVIVYYTTLIGLAIADRIVPVRLYVAWAGVYAAVYLCWLIYMLWNKPRIILGFSYDGVRRMNRQAELVPMSIAHYYTLDMFLAFVVVNVARHAAGWIVYKCVCVILILLWGPVGMLVSIPALLIAFH